MYFTAKDVLREAVQIARKNPDFVYTDQGVPPAIGLRCGYAGKKVGSTEGTPCLIGSALISLGVDPEDLKDETWGADAVVPKFAVDMHMDQVSLRRLADIQWEQDTGKSWGTSVADYETR